MTMSNMFEHKSRQEVLRLLSYHPRDFDDAVLSEFNSKRSRPKIAPPIFGTLGDFNAFPIELLNEILRHSDLYTIYMFSLLNRQARKIVRASFPYKHLLRHAPRALVALIRTGGSHWHFTVDEVFHVFCSPACSICGNFGGFLWIPDCIRCCFTCLQRAPELMPMAKTHAKMVYGLSKKALAKVPMIITLPGIYGSSYKDYRRPRYLLSRARVLQMANMTHGGEKGLAKYMESKMSRAGATLGRQMHNAARRTAGDVTRFMATIPFPYYDPVSRTKHIGLACKGCILHNVTSEKQLLAAMARLEQMYTETGFFEHLERCRAAQEFWIAPRSGSSRSPKKKILKNKVKS